MSSETTERSAREQNRCIRLLLKLEHYGEQKPQLWWVVLEMSPRELEKLWKSMQVIEQVSRKLDTEASLNLEIGSGQLIQQVWQLQGIDRSDMEIEMIILAHRTHQQVVDLGMDVELKQARPTEVERIVVGLEGLRAEGQDHRGQAWKSQPFGKSTLQKQRLRFGPVQNIQKAFRGLLANRPREMLDVWENGIRPTLGKKPVRQVAQHLDTRELLDFLGQSQHPELRARALRLLGGDKFKAVATRQSPQ